MPQIKKIEQPVEQYPLQSESAAPRINFEKLQKNIDKLIINMNRDRRQFYKITSDRAHNEYRESSKAHVDTYRSNTPLFFAAVQCALNVASLTSLIVPQIPLQGLQGINSLTGFTAIPLDRFLDHATGQYDLNQVAKISSRIFETLGKTVDSTKQLHDTYLNGDRTEAQLYNDRIRSVLDRRIQEEQQEYREEKEAIRAMEQKMNRHWELRASMAR